MLSRLKGMETGAKSLFGILNTSTRAHVLSRLKGMETGSLRNPMQAYHSAHVLSRLKGMETCCHFYSPSKGIVEVHMCFPV